MIDLRNGDCLQLLRELESGSVDLIVTDPPYRVISGGNTTKLFSGGVLGKNGTKIFKHNDTSAEEYAGELYRVLKDNSHIYVMTNTINLEHFLREFQRAGFILHNILVWEKNNALPNRWYMKNCEYTLFMRKGRAKPINNMSSKTVVRVDNIIGSKAHPTEKPVELMRLYVENSSQPGDIVLDPFMGAGSTGIACAETGRNFIGFEIDSEYFMAAKARIANTVQQISLLEEA